MYWIGNVQRGSGGMTEICHQMFKYHGTMGVSVQSIFAVTWLQKGWPRCLEASSDSKSTMQPVNRTVYAATIRLHISAKNYQP